MTGLSGRLFTLALAGTAAALPVLALAQSTGGSAGGQSVASPSAAPAAPAANAPQLPQPGLALIDQLNQAAQRLSFTGTYIHQQTSGVQGVYMAKIHQQVQPAGPVIRIESLDGDPREVVRQPKELRAYLPAAKTIKVQTGTPVRADFPMLSLQSAQQLSRYYRVSVSQGTRVAGFDTELVTLEPLDDKRWPVRCWVQRHERLMLKLQQLSHSGEVLEEQVFSELRVGHRAAPNVVSKYANETGWKTQVASVERMDSPKPLALPVAGFEVIAQMRHKPDGMRQIVVSDGLANASVFIERRKGSAEDLNTRQRGALSMASHQHGEWLVTVMGELPPVTVVTLAKAFPLSTVTTQ
jgi:sigma-E factor negative regulatory protein RseB